MPIDIYSMKLSPPSKAVLMTAQQLNIDVNIKKVDLSEGQQMTPEFLKINPAHTVPTIDDNGFVLWESRAIMQYLCNQYAPESELYPKDPKKRAVVDRWLNFDITFSVSQKEALWMKYLTGEEPTEDKLNAHKNNAKLMNQLIGENKYLTGAEMTIADLLMLATTAHLDKVEEFDLSEYPNLKRWLSSIQSELPYFNELNPYDKEEVAVFVAKYRARLQQEKASQ